MKRLVILGAGTAGTMLAHKLHHQLHDEWDITLVYEHETHIYQPGLLFVPFGENPDDLVKARTSTLPKGVHYVQTSIQEVKTDENTVVLGSGQTLDYDQLIIATGAEVVPDETPGTTGPGWRETVHEFYTLEGAKALATALADFHQGRLAVHITELPIKCPVAPLEFAFLADAHFKKLGIRDAIEITFVTPLSGAFTKPVATKVLGGMLEERNISMVPDFVVESIDGEAGTITAYDETVVPFDLLVTVPLNMGAEYIERSGLGDELNFVPVDKHTFLADGYDNIFAIGDASNIPTSKAGSVAHFSVDVFCENFDAHIAGKPLPEKFDGHANCFVESGGGKAMLIDFNYETEPLPGTYPVPAVGPFWLMKETRANHFGKLAFEKIYWSMLLPGHKLPVPNQMQKAGKDFSAAENL